ncbi:hypothetical protein AB0E06_10345 [Streptomyces sp. NPDC048109]|uniref:hypothetical protein n=1 Tax=Streptomyces sp. NPDC048109 TaxID=3155482 RepID=UPI003421CABB
MAKSGPQRYPGASTAYWHQSRYGGDAMESNVVVWHTTEGTSVPSYGGGASAPNFTAKPDFVAKRLVWYQHFDFDVSSRALVNRAGGVETNTLNVVQVEIVGTCDPATHRKWGSTPHLYTPDLPDWAVRDLAAFAKWAHDHHGVPLTSGVTFKAYPSSYGSNGVRMSASKWTSYRGHCGHQHVPENDHGDPGLLPMTAILARAKGATPTTPSTEDDMDPIDVWAYKGKTRRAADGGGRETRDAYEYLRGTNAAVKALTAQVGALTATVGTLAKGGGLDAAEIKAAAEAGAQAALAQLGDALKEG